MANTFKTVTFAAEPASAGTPYVMYTVAASTTTVVLGLVLANIHTTAVTAEVELVSTTSNRGGANNVANGTSMLVKDVSIPQGSSLEILTGSNGSNFPGLPVLTSQKAQALVHVSPIIINVACLLLQHSVIFGQLAS